MPPFADAQAYACIERAFGAPLGQVFSQLSDTAVAAASLGQVYRGTLRATGQDVAIKVCGRARYRQPSRRCRTAARLACLATAVGEPGPACLPPSAPPCRFAARMCWSR